MSDLLSAAPAAGWYPDPMAEAQLRWWDGAGWTERTTTPEAPVLVDAPAAAAVDGAPRSRRDVHPRLESGAETPEFTIPDENKLGYTPVARAPLYDQWRPPRSGTPGAWALAFLPWITQVVAFVAGIGMGFSPNSLFVPFAALGIIVLLTVSLVVRDRRRLQELGHDRPASTWWILLAPPLAYLIARTVSTHRNNGKGAGPLVLFAVNSMLVVVASFAVSLLFPEVVGVPVGR
ncbi:MAG: hypothetical protein JWP85_2058 [Rhodoglobus sp.]|nr:hypothetical protein [Rhodoglobus sp.]